MKQSNNFKHFARRLKTDRPFRQLVFFCAAFVFNIAYAVYNGVMGIVLSSIWFGSLAGYYMVLSVMRGGVAYGARKIYSKEKEAEEKDERSKLIIYLSSGIMLLVLSLALSCAIVQMSLEGKKFEHAGLLIYVAAVYTFFKITVAIVNFVKVTREDDYIRRTICDIALADALVSVLALQTAMFAAFDSEADVRWANAATGGVIGFITVAIGVVMIIISAIKLKRLKSGGENER